MQKIIDLLCSDYLTIKKILIIDDEERLRTLISRILKLEVYKVFQAADGKSGLRLLEYEEIHVVLSDVKLPDSNGLVAHR